jgi:hypothetical protein
MCPACVASAALIAAGVMSTGGLTALVATKFHPKKIASEMRSFDFQVDRDQNTKSQTQGKEQP